MTILYLYALVGDPPPAVLGHGLRREPLEALPGAGYHLIAGRMDAAPEATTTALRSHDAAVRRIARTVDAILPVRFGAVVPDEETALRWLRPRAVELAGRLVQVRGRVQMTLRLYAARGAARPPAPARRGPARARGPGARYLVARQRGHDGREVPELESIRRTLDGLVADERVQRHATPPLVASVYHLVARDRAALYRTRVLRAAARLPSMRLTVTGPWPPYAFAADAWP